MAKKTTFTLKTFQIQHCFGFRDSGKVRMEDPSNLLYILGRNSSGKTSFLQALLHLGAGLIPRSYSNFSNYNQRSDEEPRLTASFAVAANILSIDSFMRKLNEKLGAPPFSSPTVQQNATQQRHISILRDEIRLSYASLLEAIGTARTLWVRKSADGHYHFSSNANFDDFVQRQSRVEAAMAAIIPGGHLNVNGQMVPVNLQFADIEDVLSFQMPRIVFFGDADTLTDELPDRLMLDDINNVRQNALLKAFIYYLSEENVVRVLEADDDQESEELLADMNDRLAKITRQVNYVSSSTKATDLLRAKLHAVPGNPGLQLTMRTNNQPSFYGEMSNNTKYLFAYYLLQAASQIPADILLFDEPNKGFHATAQISLLAFLKSLGEQGNLVLVSTHSEHLIDPDYLSSVRVMSFDEKGMHCVLNSYLTQTAGKQEDHYTALQPLLDAIGLRYRRNLWIDDRTVVTEGITDMLYLRAFNHILGYDDAVNIAPAMSDDKVAALISLLISQDMRFKVFMDSGNVSDAIQRKFQLSDRHFQRVPVPIVAKRKKNSGVEDLFSKEDFRKRVEEAGGSLPEGFNRDSNSAYVHQVGVSKRLIADRFYAKCREFKKTDFEQETLDNFSWALTFCRNDDWCSIGGCAD